MTMDLAVPVPEDPDSVAIREVPAALGGKRLDQAAATLYDGYSRSLLSRWIQAGALTCDGLTAKPKAKLRGGETLALAIDAVPYENWSEPQPMPLEVVFEDEHLLVINKPAGLVVHPGAGNLDGTLVNGLLAYRASQQGLPRAGIVHRLDKDTSGLMLVAASLPALNALTEAIRARSVGRRYQALALGDLDREVLVDAPLGRDPRVPTRQAVRADGRPARTRVRPQQRFGFATLIEARLDTGRTHQIRVHLQHLGHPLLGDARYGGLFRNSSGAPAGRAGSALSLSEPLAEALSAFPRQALHAARLDLAHPLSDVPLSFRAPLPADLDALVSDLAPHAL